MNLTASDAGYGHVERSRWEWLEDQPRARWREDCTWCGVRSVREMESRRLDKLVGMHPSNRRSVRSGDRTAGWAALASLPSRDG